MSVSNPRSQVSTPGQFGDEPPVRRHYAPELDGLRAICIMLTLVVHVATLPIRTNGTIGVDIFFALSGWLITWLLVDEQQRRGAVSLGAFYIRRFFRIVPLYAVTIVLYLLAAAALRHRGDLTTWRETMQSLPYFATFNAELQTGSGLTFWHAWTLGIEEKFYLVWPALFFLFPRRPWTAAAIAVLLSCTITAMWGFSTFLLRGYWGLGLGTALALVAHHRRGVLAWLGRATVALPAAIAIAIIDLLSIFIAPTYSGWNMLVSPLAALMVGSLWTNRHQPGASWLAAAPFVWLGRLTYGIYLIHVLVLNVVRHAGISSPWLELLLTYGGSIGAAYILHWTIERPLIAIGRSLAARTRRLDVVTA